VHLYTYVLGSWILEYCFFFFAHDGRVNFTKTANYIIALLIFPVVFFINVDEKSGGCQLATPELQTA